MRIAFNHFYPYTIQNQKRRITVIYSPPICSPIFSPQALLNNLTTLITVFFFIMLTPHLNILFVKLTLIVRMSQFQCLIIVCLQYTIIEHNSNVIFSVHSTCTHCNFEHMYIERNTYLHRLIDNFLLMHVITKQFIMLDQCLVPFRSTEGRCSHPDPQYIFSHMLRIPRILSISDSVSVSVSVS